MKTLITNNFSEQYLQMYNFLTPNNSDFQTYISQIHHPDKESYTWQLLIKLQNGKFSTNLYDKRGDLSFQIVNFPHMDIYIPSKQANGVVIWQFDIQRCRVVMYTKILFTDRNYSQLLTIQTRICQKLCSTYKMFVHRYH